VRERLRADRGSALVEFALVMPVLVLLLVGALDVARAANAYAVVASAAREGSHYASLHPTAAPLTIATVVRARVEPLDPSSLIVEASYHDGTAFVSWPAGGIPASSPAVTSVPARVRVTYPWQALTAILGGLFSTASLSASSTADATR
jgi:Flp pilus assembly protein TadG